jgi:hypothetical protein
MRFSRVSPALALTVGVLAIAGCGGSSGGASTNGGSGTTATASGPTLTLQQWEAKLKSVGSELQNSFAPVKQAPSDPSSWDAAASNLDKINTELAAIKPPAKVAGVTAALVTGIKPLAGEARQIGTDFKNGNKTQAQADALKFQHTALLFFQKLEAALLKLKPGSVPGSTTP